LSDFSCKLVMTCSEYGPSEKHPTGYNEDLWTCELLREDSSRLGVEFVVIDESPAVATILATAISGSSILTMSEAIIDQNGKGGPRIHFPPDAQVRLSSISKAAAATNQVPKFGTLKTLVVRVIDRNGDGPDANSTKLENDIFGDGVCLKTQMEACSYGKLKIQPFQGTSQSGIGILNGIVDLEVDFDPSDQDPDFLYIVRNGCGEKLGGFDEFDIVMFCVPPGVWDWSASANVGLKFTWYNNNACNLPSFQMHEVGHNLGLDHSGIDGKGKYADRMGYMGSSDRREDTRKCYNPAKSYQLGWYSDKVKSVNPLNGKGTRQFLLNGISDYKKNENALVGLRLNQISQDESYFVGFNRADGINKDTDRETKDQVFIVRKSGLPEDRGLSWRVGALKLGQSHEIENFDGVRNITVRYLGLINDSDVTVQIIDPEDPPSPPGKCETFTIEVTTDLHPKDNSWYIMDAEGIGMHVDSFLTYTETKIKYVHKVCLPMRKVSKKYKFTIYDSYGDGLGRGGSYEIFDEDDNVIVSEPSKKFKVATHFIDVPPLPPSPTGTPSLSPTLDPSITPSLSPTLVPSTSHYPSNIESTTFPTNEPSTKPTLKVCTDDTTWFRAGTKKKSKQRCGWVRQNPTRRCKKKIVNREGVKALDACPIACGSKLCTIPKCKGKWLWKTNIVINGKKSRRTCAYLEGKENLKGNCENRGKFKNQTFFGYEACQFCDVCKY